MHASEIAGSQHTLQLASDILSKADEPAMKEILDARLVREGRMELAQSCFDFLPTRARLDLAGWPEIDIFAHS